MVVFIIYEEFILVFYLLVNVNDLSRRNVKMNGMKMYIV